MKYLFLDDDSIGCPLAYRVQQAGNDVLVHINRKDDEHKYSECYGDLIKKVTDWKKYADWADVIVFPTVRRGAEADALRATGKKVVGSCGVRDKIELDRDFGCKFVSKYGIKVPESKEFTDFKSGIEYLKKTKKRVVLKPSGNMETFWIYPAISWEDAVEMMEHWSKTWTKDIKYELQDYVEGQQMSCEGWWNGKQLVGWNSTFEAKPLFMHELGVFTGETGSVVFYYPNQVNKMCDYVRQVEQALIENDVSVGPIDVNFIVNADGAHFLEFTARFGYPATFIQMNSVEDDWGKVLSDLAQGDGTFTGFHPKPYNWFIGARVVVPKWPFGETEKKFVHAPLLSRMEKNPEAKAEFIPMDVTTDENGKLVVANIYGELGTMTARGNMVLAAKDKLVHLLREIWLYPLGWREDIGENVRYQFIKQCGYWLPDGIPDKDRFEWNEAITDKERLAKAIEVYSEVVDKFDFKFDPNSTENEGRFRVRDPQEFDGKTFRSWSDWEGLEAEGVRFIVGDLKDSGEKSLQAVRFNKDVWDDKKAGMWVKKNGVERVSTGKFDEDVDKYLTVGSVHSPAALPDISIRGHGPKRKIKYDFSVKERNF